MAQLPPLALKRGTTSAISITIPADLDPAGATVFFTVKPSELTRQQADTDRLAILKKTITERTGRTFTADIEPEDTNTKTPGRYTYGITVKLATGEIYGTKATGLFTLEPRDTADVEGEA